MQDFTERRAQKILPCVHWLITIVLAVVLAVQGSFLYLLLHPSKTETLPYAGYTWAAVGDSLTELLTENWYTSKAYHTFVSEELGIEVLNYGISGCGYKRNGTFAQTIKNIDKDFDVLTIFGSFNDINVSLNYPLGTVYDTGEDTICGCINKAIDTFYALFPDKKLGLATPTPWGQYFTGSLTDSTLMEDYANAILTIAKMRGIPCLDLYHESGLRPWDESFRKIYYKWDNVNGVHPSDAGHEFIAPLWREFIQSLL